jgi:transcriptional regulator with XRE-family HTH domain
MDALGETGVAIRWLRARRGWTQARLAKEMGTDPVTVSRWERGVSRPRPGARKRLTELGVDPGPRSTVKPREDPTVRIRKLDRARLDQLSLKRRTRLA